MSVHISVAATAHHCLVGAAITGLRMNFFPEATAQSPESTRQNSRVRIPVSQELWERAHCLGPRGWGWLWLCQAQGSLPKGWGTKSEGGRS